MHHYRKTIKKYVLLNKQDKKKLYDCSLCENIESNQIEETDTMIVVKNRVPYDMFEGLATTGEHLMILPKRHLERFDEFSDQEMLECMKLIAKYEGIGFSVYARSTTNIHRSQPHQHTHLIRLENYEPRLVIYSNKPYRLIKI